MYKSGMNTRVCDETWMRYAIEQAKQGIGLTTPNPCVGAVIVCNDCIIGKGFHPKAGLPHAERYAIADAIARGNAHLLCKSTIYVTLEPCSTTGKTPPCTEAIIENNLKRVVYGSQDPNPKHQGRAAIILREVGIDVVSGVLEDECDYLIRNFRMNVVENRPWVIVKSAMSLDGRISRSPERSQWLTNNISRSYVHSLRAEVDAIITGGNTVRIDNPAFTIRTPSRVISVDKLQPWRVILTHDKNSIPSSSCCLCDEYRDRTLVFEKITDFRKLLEELYESRNISTLMIEAGGSLVKEFLRRKLVDEWVGFYAPMIVGAGVEGIAGGDFLENEAHLCNPEVQCFGSDICVRGLIQYK